MVNIRNNKVYFSEMSKTLQDKLFFLKYIGDIDILVDFGCGDGNLISNLLENNKIKYGFGYDANMYTIVENKNKYINKDNVYFSFDFYDILSRVWKYLNKHGLSKVVILFSSVFHEMDRKDINRIIELTHSTNIFDYVVVRDMFSFQQDQNINFFELSENIKNVADPQQIQDFEDFYGEILLPDSIIHFLLKQRYKTNWKQELEEDYLSHSFQSIQRQFESVGYELIYDNKYCHEFLSDEISEKFNIDFNYITHGELIYKL